MNQYIWYSPLKYLWSIYRKLACVGFEPTTTEFHSDALTDWAIRLWVQLRLRTNFVPLLQFQIFVQCSHFVLAIVFVSRHICFKQNLLQGREFINRELKSNSGQFSIATSKILQLWISYVSIHSATNVINGARLFLKQMCRLTKTMTKTKCEYCKKSWNWSSCIKLARSAS